MKMARTSHSLVPPTSPPSQGCRLNRYRPNFLIRDILKAASTDTAQTTSTENQLSGFLFFHLLPILLYCFLYEGVRIDQTRDIGCKTEKERDNLCIDVYNYVLQKTVSQ